MQVSERTTRWPRLVLASGVTAMLALAAVACGDEEADPGSTAPTPTGAEAGGDAEAGGGDVLMSEAAQRGEELSRSQGCAGCHGQDFGGGAGPSWIGLAGSEVLLADGTTVVADDAYLTRAIAEPSAEIVADSALQMPANSLSDDQIADIVAYINTLADG